SATGFDRRDHQASVAGPYVQNAPYLGSALVGGLSVHVRDGGLPVDGAAIEHARIPTVGSSAAAHLFDGHSLVDEGHVRVSVGCARALVLRHLSQKARDF